MENIVGYSWKLYYDATLLHEDYDIHETEEDAKEAAEYEINERIEMWKLDGSWHPENGDSRDNFDIVIEDVTEEIE